MISRASANCWSRGGACGSAQIVPESWIDDITRNGDRDAWAAGDLAAYFPGLPLRYRSQWYVRDGADPLVFGYGIHGQFLVVDRSREVVIAKVSSEALPMDPERIGMMIRAASRITDFLASR